MSDKYLQELEFYMVFVLYLSLCLHSAHQPLTGKVPLSEKSCKVISAVTLTKQNAPTLQKVQ